MKRNPWTGTSRVDKEFWHDVRHPREWAGRIRASMRGEHPEIPPEGAYLFLAVAVVGLANFAVGIVMVVAT